VAGTRLWRIGFALGLVFLSACAAPDPSSSRPSILPSPSEPPAPSLETTTVPATPPQRTPPAGGSADVVVAVDDARIAYPIDVCPVTAWLDDAIEDDVNFGNYPDYLEADDGTRWSAHLAVLRITNLSVTDWSFYLTSPLSGIPGDVERSLISQPDPAIQMQLSISPSRAVFLTGFYDSASTGPYPVVRPGSISVTCR
jgi:hypothetical protein